VATRAGRNLVFVSYSRDDAEWMQAFRVMLTPVLEDLGFELWVDTELRVGEEWDPQVESAIARSELALLLVSSRFLFSDYIRRRELPALWEHEVRLAPILVGSCAHERVLPELAAVQWLHDTGRDGALNLVEQVGERDRRIWQACEKLLRLLPERKRAPRPTAHPAPAPVPTLAAVPAQTEPGELSGVPEPPPGYVAREELVDLIEAVTGVEAGAVGVVGGGRSFGLHGQGGIGKSVLAAAVARDPDVRRRFPDGVFWVTIGEAGDVLAAQLDLLARLDPTADRPRTPAEAQQALRGALADRRTLLVVDDVWSDAAAHAFRLNGPRGRVLYTTRDARVLDAAGARPFPVESLSLASARVLAAAVLAVDHLGVVAPAPATPVGLPPAADPAIEQVERVALAVALLAAAVRGGRTWGQVAADLARNSDVFGDHPYANTFKAMQIGVAALPGNLAQALLGLVVFPPDTRTPVVAIARYWSHTRGVSAEQTLSDLRRLAAASTLVLDGDSAGTVEFHDLQHEYLMLHAGPMPELHAGLLDAYRALRPARDQWWQLDPEEPYIWEHLVTHLRGAGARRELGATVSDPLYLVRRIAISGVLVTENDLAQAARTLPDNPDVAWWRAWLPRHADLLALPRRVTAEQRVRALAPTLRAWLAADPTRPATVDADRLLSASSSPCLNVEHGLVTPSSAQTRVLTGHVGRVQAIAWSSDGTQLATVDASGTARIWDPTTGRTTTRTSFGHMVGTLAWSPGGTLLAVVGANGTLRIWESATGRTTAIVADDPSTISQRVSAVAWSPDRSRLAAAVSTKIQIWDLVANRATRTLHGHSSPVSVLAWSPDSTHLVATSRAVRVWDTNSGQVIRTLTGHTQVVTAAAWSPDGTRVAAASRDCRVRLWNPTTGHTTGILIGHTRRVESMAWSPGGEHLATTSADQTTRIWDPATGRTTTTLTGHILGVHAVAWSPDGTHLATGGADATVRIWDPMNTRGIEVRTDPSHTVDAVAWSPDHRHLATTSEDGTIRIWDPTTGAATRNLPGDSWPTIATWSPDSTRIVIADRTARICDATTGATIRVLDAVGRIRVGAWSPDGTRLAIAGDDDGSVKICNSTTGSIAHTLTRHPSAVNALAWSPDGAHLATGGDGPIRIWNSATWSTICTLTGFEHGVHAVTWSASGVRVAAAAGDEVRVWEIRSALGRRKYSWRHRIRPAAVLSGHLGGVSTAIWSPDSRRIATVAVAGRVSVWNPSTGRTLAVLQNTGSTVTDIRWAPDSAWLAMAWSGGSVTLHEPHDLNEISRLRLGAPARIDWADPGIAAAMPESVALLTLLTT
jgi:WD40 repeat protein